MSGWLVVIALVGGVNAARLAPVLPRGDRTVGERVAVGGLGALLACAVLGVLVAAGDATASWLDVSAPTFAVAAGLVLVLGAIAQAVRVPRAEPSLPGRQAAVVPVAVPFVLRPDLGLVCLAAGASDTGLAATVGLVLAVTSVVAAAAIDVDGVRGRVVRWTAWGLGVATIAAGIAITVDGVLAV